MTKKAPDWLLPKIMDDICQRQTSAARRKIIIFSACGIFSLALFASAGYKFLASGSESGFFRFFSLLFSDFSVIANYWKNFAMALLESAPVIELAAALAGAFLFLESLKLTIKNIYGHKYKTA